MTTSSAAALHESEQRLVRTVDSLADDQWSQPSVLPGWTRAHVVAHLALNAEGMAGALDALRRGERGAMYESNEKRDADIEELAAEPVADIRDRLFAAGERLREAFAALTDEEWGGSVDRVLGGPQWPVLAMPGARRREVEIHHADIGCGYRHTDWPRDFCHELLDVLATEQAGNPETATFRVSATDLGRSWSVGADQPVVSGSGADLAWWLAGRGSGEGLSTATGVLPRIGAWRRTPAPTPDT
ncbi:MAG TPA: maleylpyruvate isomerase family mycothiol-dependent enzyme [Marmoricola sp.]|nr:maleylpyruvate isomerase family mycothiol-dependent enzyme [Marmoricola sp.]